MPRYYFNVHNLKHGRDDIGDELPDDEAAWKEATLIAGELFKNVVGKFRPGQEWSLEVTDDQRRTLYSIQISARDMRYPA
jgi:hypothetical protein